MITAYFPDGGDTLVESSWNEQANKAFCLLLHNMNAAGIAMSQPESDDFSAAETAFNTLGGQLKTWYDGAVTTASEGNVPDAFDPDYLPDILTFIALLATQQWGAIFVLFCKIGLRFLTDTARKKLDPTTSGGDVAELLKALLGVLDENGNIVGSKVDGLTNLTIRINMNDDDEITDVDIS
jgi:hypothetical protein